MTRLFVVCLACVALNSCNTCIGIGRDTKEAFLWTKAKMQGNGGGSSPQPGAPVY